MNTDAPERSPPTPVQADAAGLSVRRGRMVYVALAWSALSLGVLGVFLPVLPTTPFILLAAWAAARSSPRLHARLCAHPVFGPMIRDWEASGAVSRRAKRWASAMMALCALLLFLWSPLMWVPWLASATMFCVSLWLWSRPEPRGDAIDARHSEDDEAMR